MANIEREWVTEWRAQTDQPRDHQDSVWQAQAVQCYREDQHDWDDSFDQKVLKSGESWPWRPELSTDFPVASVIAAQVAYNMRTRPIIEI